jgi:hypothetical protein
MKSEQFEQCISIIQDLMKISTAIVFNELADPQSQGPPDYELVIKQAKDFESVLNDLSAKKYESIV